MSDPATHWLAHAERLPILTEVVEVGGVRQAFESQPFPLAQPQPQPVVPPPQVIDAARLVEQVLEQVARQVDAGFEAQLRGALAPAVARAVGTLLAEGRVVLSASLRVLVEHAVARALAERGQSASEDPF